MYKVTCAVCQASTAIKVANPMNYTFMCISCRELLVVNADLSTSRLMDQTYVWTKQSLEVKYE